MKQQYTRADRRTYGRIESIIYDSLVRGLYVLQDPHIKNIIFHLNHVSVSKADKKATCYISIIDNTENKISENHKSLFLKALHKAEGFLRGYVHQDAIIKVVPKLIFKLADFATLAI